MSATFWPEQAVAATEEEVVCADREFLSLHHDPTETALLGCILLDPSAADLVLSRVKPEHLWRNANKEILRAALEVREQGRPVELLTVAYRLRGKPRPEPLNLQPYKADAANLLDACGGPEYLMSCIASVTTTAHVNVYVTQALELYEQRVAYAVQHGVYGSESVGDMMDRLRSVREELTWRGGARGISEYPVLESIEAHVARKEFDHRRPHFDIDTIDCRTGGMPCPGYVIVMGDSGMGKTALALQAAHHWSLGHGQPCVYFSLEMDAETQLIPRLAHLECGRGASTEEELYEAGTRILCSPLILDASTRSLEQIVAEAKRLARDPSPRLVVVDYAGLVQTARRMDERQRLEHISLELKQLSKDSRATVISLSQVTWDQDRRDATTFGARGSEHDADMVVEVRRPGQTAYERRQSREAEVYIRKNRNGEVCSASTAFMGLRFRQKDTEQDEATEARDGYWWNDGGGA